MAVAVEVDQELESKLGGEIPKIMKYHEISGNWDSIPGNWCRTKMYRKSPFL